MCGGRPSGCTSTRARPRRGAPDAQRGRARPASGCCAWGPPRRRLFSVRLSPAGPPARAPATPGAGVFPPPPFRPVPPGPRPRRPSPPPGAPRRLFRGRRRRRSNATPRRARRAADVRGGDGERPTLGGAAAANRRRRLRGAAALVRGRGQRRRGGRRRRGTPRSLAPLMSDAPLRARAGRDGSRPLRGAPRRAVAGTRDWNAGRPFDAPVALGPRGCSPSSLERVGGRPAEPAPTHERPVGPGRAALGARPGPVPFRPGGAPPQVTMGVDPRGPGRTEDGPVGSAGTGTWTPKVDERPLGMGPESDARRPTPL